MRSTLTDKFAEQQVPVSTRDPLSHMTIHRYRVQPGDLGSAGVVDGGTLLEWVHRAAHTAPQRHGGVGFGAWPRPLPTSTWTGPSPSAKWSKYTHA
jgi:hypothetical protein